ncbi:choice-of-anchor Q domain-containing protein [Lacipirellula sp.]|uniref:choice-of-anchor Q domain-containing protein n=1 Tax=Lacipirellula sp. TaxID=2691419 RepID=UPI003D0FCF4F
MLTVITVNVDYDEQDNNISPGNDISLRDAIYSAASGDTINFANGLSGHTFLLNFGGELLIDKNLTIDGVGKNITIDAGGDTRVFSVTSGAIATIQGVKITGGGGVAEGGGIYNLGNLTLDGVEVVGNDATSAGGGIASTNAAKLHLLNSTVDDNEAPNAGGLHVVSHGGQGELEIVNSTVSNNRATDAGGMAGGLYLWNGVSGTIVASIENSTFSGNTAKYSGGIRVNTSGINLSLINATIARNEGDQSGGLQIFNTPVVSLYNTILAENTTTSDVEANLWGSIASGSSNNLFGSDVTSGQIPANQGNIKLAAGKSARLTPLGAFGGTTKTHALLPDSPAIDAGYATPPGGLASLDQRGSGYSRATDGAGNGSAIVDIGAYEAPAVIVVSTDDDPASPSGGHTLRTAIVAANATPEPNRIKFDLTANSTITLASGQLAINGDLWIDGGGLNLTVDVNTASPSSQGRVLEIAAGKTVTLKDLTLTGGNVTGAGGGILNAGDLTLLHVAVLDNEASVSGGGIQSVDWVGGTASLHLIDSTIDGNRSVTGSGVNAVVASGEALEIVGSTISNNVGFTSYSEGGGIAIAGASGGAVTISNSTISGNSALYSGGVRMQNNNAATTIVNSTIAYNFGDQGGGLQRLGSTTAKALLYNTIIAENKNYLKSADSDVNGSVHADSAYNLIGRGGAGDLTDGDAHENLVLTSGENAGLAPLGDYGGKTKTHALKVGSQALDHGSTALLASGLDQRGYARGYDMPGVSPGIGGNSDIGAFEASEATTLIVRSDGDRNDSVDLPATINSLRLREALALSAVLAGEETIYFDKSGWADSEISLGLGQLEVTHDVVINGPGADEVTVNAQEGSRVFEVSAGVAATFRGLTITGGSTAGVGGGISQSVYSADNALTIDGCQIESNSAQNGGGLYFRGGDLVVTNSTFYDNDADNGAGVYLKEVAKADVINTTISTNIATASGGGIYNADSSAPKIINSTIAYNQAATGGGLYSATAGVLVVNTIVAKNTATTSPDIDGTFNGGSRNNFIGVDRVTLNGIDNEANGNTVGEAPAPQPPLDPLLKSLGYYGGPTKTHALNGSSPAKNKGDNSILEEYDLVFDQRGSNRTRDEFDRVDIGAFELAFDEL